MSTAEFSREVLRPASLIQLVVFDSQSYTSISATSEFDMTMTSLIATLSAPPSADGVELTTLPASVEWLEVRADLVGDLDTDWLRDHFRGRLIYSFPNEATDRHQRLIAAAERYDRVELDADRDFSTDLLN